MLELGRELYVRGPFKEGLNWFGDKNLIWPWLMVFGDWRTAAGFNDNSNAGDNASIATRLNLDIDVKLTATERMHFAVRPFEKNGRITEIDLRNNGENGPGDSAQDLHVDFNLDAAFFEGDFGAIMSGATGRPSRYDLPFAVGLMPILVQNGVWIEDAFQGLAVTIPARNSKRLNISNYDVTFFAGMDDVTTAAAGAAVGENNVSIFGANAFIEANEGYWEAGYGYTHITHDNRAFGTNDDLDYHNLTVAFSKRYGAILSNSIRAIFNFGQDSSTKTADGVLLLVENSLITSKPSTLVPYANFFVGINTPQSLARAAGAGGVLKNTGINFETDGLTGFPKLTDTASDAYGGAVGIEYLFALDKQFVIEVAAQDSHGRKSTVAGAETALGVRFQMPISHRWIVRADAMVGAISGDDDIAGVRVEFPLEVLSERQQPNDRRGLHGSVGLAPLSFKASARAEARS